MKNKTIYFSLFSGIVMTLLYLVAIFLPDNSKWIIVLNFVAMLGSGIFCSALVSLLFAKENEKQIAIEKSKRREFYFNYLVISLKGLMLDELKQFCNVLKIEYSVKNPLWQGTSIEKVVELLQQDIAIIQKNNEYSNQILFDANILAKYIELEYVLISLQDKGIETVLMDIVGIKGIQFLQRIEHRRQNIIDCYEKQNYEALLQHKKCFFDDVIVLFGIVEPRYKNTIFNIVVDDN